MNSRGLKQVIRLRSKLVIFGFYDGRDMDVIDRLSAAMKQLKQMNVEIRLEDLNGVPSGLCKIGGQSVLMVEVSLRSAEQLVLFQQTIKKIRQSAKAAA